MSFFGDATAAEFVVQASAQPTWQVQDQRSSGFFRNGRGRSRSPMPVGGQTCHAGSKSFEDFLWEQVRGLIQTISLEHSERVTAVRAETTGLLDGQKSPEEVASAPSGDVDRGVPVFGKPDNVASCDSEPSSDAKDSVPNGNESRHEDSGGHEEPLPGSPGRKASKSPKPERPKLQRSNTPTIHEDREEHHEVTRAKSMPHKRGSRNQAQLDAVQRALSIKKDEVSKADVKKAEKSDRHERPAPAENRQHAPDGATAVPATWGDPQAPPGQGVLAAASVLEALEAQLQMKPLTACNLEAHLHHRAHERRSVRRSQLEGLGPDLNGVDAELGEEQSLTDDNHKQGSREHGWRNSLQSLPEHRPSQKVAGAVAPGRRSIESEIDVMLGFTPSRPPSALRGENGKCRSARSTVEFPSASRQTSLQFDGDERIDDAHSQSSSNASGCHFETLAIWDVRGKSLRLTRTTTRRVSEAVFNVEDSNSEDSDEYEEYEDGVPKKKTCCKKLLQAHWTIRPNHIAKVCWDMIGFVLITYDFVMIPLQFFDPPSSKFLETMVWAVRMYWTCDFPVSIFTAYENKSSSYERRLGKVWCHYAKTWLLFDTLILALDYLEMAVSGLSGLGAARAGKIGKSVRLLRMFRVLRMLRRTQLPESVKVLVYKLQSEQYMIMFGIIRIIILLLGLVHLIACCWYGIGSGGSSNWVDNYGMDERSFNWRYTTSFHWSLTQFAGSMDIQPHNVGERAFAVFALICGFFVSACVVSSITSNMTRLQIVLAHESTQVALLNRYLIDNCISTKLAMRVQRNAMYAYQQDKKNVPESSIELLQLVSDPLRVELHYEMYVPFLTQHPFFDMYNKNAPSAMRRLCHTAICRMTLSAGDVLFSAGETPQTPWMYFLTHGYMAYLQEHTEKPTLVMEGQWASEAVLWTGWIHHGTLRAKQEVIVMGLGAKSFQDIASRFQTKEFCPKRYADEFVLRLNESDRWYLSDLSEHLAMIEELCNKAFSQRMVSTRSGMSDRTERTTNRRTTNDPADLENLHQMLRRTISRSLSKLSVASGAVSRQLSTISNRISRTSRVSRANSLWSNRNTVQSTRGTTLSRQGTMQSTRGTLQRNHLSIRNSGDKLNRQASPGQEPDSSQEFHAIGSFDSGIRNASRSGSFQPVVYESAGEEAGTASKSSNPAPGMVASSDSPQKVVPADGDIQELS